MVSWRCLGPVFLQPVQDRVPGWCPVEVSCLSFAHCPTCKARHCQDSCWTPQLDTHLPCSRTPASAACRDSKKSQCRTPVQDTSAALLRRPLQDSCTGSAGLLCSPSSPGMLAAGTIPLLLLGWRPSCEAASALFRLCGCCRSALQSGEGVSAAAAAQQHAVQLPQPAAQTHKRRHHASRH